MVTPGQRPIGPFFRFFELDTRSTYLLTLRRAGRDRPVSVLLQLEDQEGEKLDLWYRLSLLLVTAAFAVTSIVLIVFRPCSLLVWLAVSRTSRALWFFNERHWPA